MNLAPHETEGPEIHMPWGEPSSTKVGQVESASVGWAMKSDDPP